MAAWQIEFTKAATRDFQRLDLAVRRQIYARLDWFSENFDFVNKVPLHGEWSDFMKLRMGDWRIMYRVNNTAKIIEVAYIDHRSRAYRNRKRK